MNIFVWPSLENEVVSKTGFCYGLDSHFGILTNGMWFLVVWIKMLV
jgi:hypothetical protein